MPYRKNRFESEIVGSNEIERERKREGDPWINQLFDVKVMAHKTFNPNGNHSIPITITRIAKKTNADERVRCDRTVNRTAFVRHRYIYIYIIYYLFNLV